MSRSKVDGLVTFVFENFGTLCPAPMRVGQSVLPDTLFSFLSD